MSMSFRDALLRMFRGSRRSVRRKYSPLWAESLEMRAMLTTFFVDGGAADGGDGTWENPFNTIQFAIEAAANNDGDDTVAIQPGVYHETLQINDTSGALTLTGISGDRESVVIQNNTSENTIEIVGSLDVQISHLTVQAGNDIDRGGARGIWYRDARDRTRAIGGLSVENVVVQGHVMGGVVAERVRDVFLSDSLVTNNFNGIFADNVGHVTLEEVTAVFNHRDGAQINSASSLTLFGGAYDDNQIHGLFAGNTGSVVLENSTFNRNNDNGVDLRGVQVVAASDIDVKDNGSLGVLDGFIVTGSGAKDVVLTRITASGNTGTGIGLRAVSESVQATQIVANENGLSGLTVANAPITMSLQDSEFIGNSRHGIYLGGLSSMTIDNIVAVENGFANNNADGGGGGIRVESSVDDAVFTLTNSLLSHNVSPVGGGGLSVAGSVRATIENVLIIGNQATGLAAGGGISITSNASGSVIRHSNIADNSANLGGGIHYRLPELLSPGSLLIEESTISTNVALSGGGIYHQNQELHIRRSTIDTNSATNAFGGGGGLYIRGETRIENSTISGNMSANDGGGIAVRNNPFTLRLYHTTITNNVADGSGGGIDRTGTVNDVVVGNSLIAVNTASDGLHDYAGEFQSAGSNLIGNGTGAVVDAVFDQIGTAENPIDPLLGPLAENGGPTRTHALLSGSPAIDAVSSQSSVALNHDQRNVSRPLGRAPDIGAYEYEPGPNRPPIANDDHYSTRQDSTLVVNVNRGPGILDQVNDRNTGLHQFNAASLDLQQQVVAGQSGFLTSVDVYIGQFSNAGRVLDFYVNRGPAPQTDTPEFRTEYTLASKDIDNWITIDVSSANIYLDAGEAFTIGAFARSPTNLFLLATNSDHVSGDSYPAGRLWVNGSPEVTPGGRDYDLLFRTRMTDSLTTGGVLANDTDPDGDTLTAHLLTQAQYGTVTLNSDGGFTYVPNLGFFGEDFFTYLADDGNGGSDTATVYITVEFVNSPPVVGDHHFIIPENLSDGSLVGQVEATDGDGDPLTFAIISGNEAEAFAISSDGEIRVTNSSLLDFATTPIFNLVVVVSDGQLSATSAVVIELTQVDQTIPVMIDILPGDSTNRIDLTKNQALDVVIFSSSSFDATQIDVDTLRLGATGTEDSLRRRGKHQTPQVRFVDVNGNGLLDLVVTFDSGLMGLTAEDTEAILTGKLLDGRSIMGSDSVSVSSGKGGSNGGGKGNGGGNGNSNAGPKK